MISFDHAPNTAGMNPLQLEFAGQVAFSTDRLVSFVPFIVGAWLDSLMLGVILVLFAQWAVRSRPTDRLIVQALVYWTVLVSIIGSAWLIGQAVFLFAAHFGEYKTFLRAELGAASKIPGSCFFLHRAYLISGRQKWLPILVVPMQVCILAGSIALTPMLTSLPYGKDVKYLLVSITSCEVISDLVMTITIAVYLYKQKTGWSGTDALLNKLIYVNAETRAPLTLMTILVLVVFVKYSNSMIQVILLFHPKLAVACVLIVITSRVNIARSVVGTSQMPQSYGTPYVSMSGASKGDSLASDSYVGTYSQVKRGEIAQNVQASGTVEYDTEVSLGDGRGLRADRRGGWPEITQTGSLGIWDHPVMREAPDAHAQSLSRGL